MTWQPPDWVRGVAGPFTITASQVSNRASRYACPMKTALAARRSTLKPVGERWARTWDPASRLWFGLMDALMAVEVGDPVTFDDALTTVQRAFVEHCLPLFADLAEIVSTSAGTDVRPVEPPVYSGEGFTIKASGAAYEGDDGRTVESVRLRYGRLRGLAGDAELDDLATRLLVLERARPAATRFRVSEVSLLTGEHAVLFDGSREQARALYAERGRPVQLALAGTELRPGSGCADCDVLSACPGPLRLPGALGLPRRAVATRALTATDLHVYDRCPRQWHGQRHAHLPPRWGPDGPPSGEAQLRGLAVHRWLHWAHERGVACSEADLAEGPLTDEERLAAAPYLTQHLDTCLLRHDDISAVRCEPLHVVHDPQADVVVSMAPDLTLVVGGAIGVWRETKTSAGWLPADVRAAVEAYPAFALAVTLLAAGVAGAGVEAVAELEVLTPSGAEVFTVATSEGDLVVHAQRVVAEVGHRWSQDLTFQARPSGLCATCAVYGWCDPPPPDQRPVVVDDAEHLGFADPF